MWRIEGMRVVRNGGDDGEIVLSRLVSREAVRTQGEENTRLFSKC